MNLDVARMRRDGKSASQIDQSLKTGYGLDLVSQPSGIEPMSTNSNISVPPPSIYKDSCSSYYNIFATWNWTSIQALKDDRSFWCGAECALGGEDGFGVAFNRNVSAAGGYSMTTWGQTSMYPVSISRADVSDANVYGASFTGVDHFYFPCCSSWDYSWYHGQLVYSTNNPGCGTLQAFSKYGHDWSSTTINSFGVGPYSLSIGWSSSSNRWSKASQPSNMVIPC